MLLLSLPALIIGVASSLVLIAAMKVASVFQQFLWQRLPTSIGIAYDSPFWIVGMLTLTGIVVGLIIRYSPGHAGPDPAIEPLISMPVSPSALPGLLLALIIGLAGGVSLGPEHPIMTINIALAAAFGSRLFPRITALDWTILASAGTIGALFGTPVAAALIFSQTLSGSNDIPMWDRLFAPLMAAAAGSLTTSLFFHPHFSLPIAHYTQMRLVDIASGAIVAAIAIAAGMVAVWCLPRLHELLHRLAIAGGKTVAGRQPSRTLIRRSGGHYPPLRASSARVTVRSNSGRSAFGNITSINDRRCGRARRSRTSASWIACVTRQHSACCAAFSAGGICVQFQLAMSLYRWAAP
ncbi:putative ion channel protein [Salmonella enterica subsp. enterica serovar Enteritidis str. SE8a]|nr:putative ion channel protein [Salmonella enterica subsp. enterica serovar Enteritidis str. SE8a]